MFPRTFFYILNIQKTEKNEEKRSNLKKNEVYSKDKSANMAEYRPKLPNVGKCHINFATVSGTPG